MKKTAMDDAIDLLMGNGWKEVGVSIPRKFVFNDHRATVGTRNVHFWRAEGDTKKDYYSLSTGQQAGILAQIRDRGGIVND